MSARVGFSADGAGPIGDVFASLLNRGARRRKGAVVRRGSVLRGSLQGFFRAVDPKSKGLTLKAAKRFDKLTKTKGKRNGALGYTGLLVLEALFDIVDYRSGRLEPSYKWIHERTKLSISAISAALKRLASNGFLKIVRRYERTDNNEGGPPVRQISNAYRIELPPVAAKTLRTPPPPPIPDDEAARREEASAEYERMICQLPDWQQPIVRANVVDQSLEAALFRLGRLVFAADPAATSCDSSPR